MKLWNTKDLENSQFIMTRRDNDYTKENVYTGAQQNQDTKQNILQRFREPYP